MNQSNFLHKAVSVVSATLTLLSFAPRKGSSAQAAPDPAFAAATMPDFARNPLSFNLPATNRRPAQPAESQAQGSGPHLDFNAPFLAFKIPNSANKAVAAADFLGDGATDVVVACTDSNLVVPFVGYGDGTMDPMSAVAVAAAPSSVNMANLNADPYRDLVIGHNVAGAQATVLFNQGKMALQGESAVGSPLPGYAPRSAVAGPVDADGTADVVVGLDGGNSVAGKVQVLHGNGNGTFTPIGTYDTGPGLRAVALGDVTGDGRLDIVTSNYAGASVLVNNGAGFNAAINLATPVSGTIPSAVAIADLNGDSRADLALACGASKQAQVFLNDGTPTRFSSGAAYTVTSSVGGPVSIAAIDVDQDGRPDLVTGQRDENTQSLTLLRNNGDGTFAPRENYVVTGGGAVAAANFDLDSRPDLVTAGNKDRMCIISNPDSALGKSQLRDTGVNAVDAKAADLNGDLLNDLVVLQGAVPGVPATVRVALGTSAGEFTDFSSFSCGPWAGNSVAVGDLNQDGIPDIAVSGDLGGSAVQLYNGAGDGTFYVGNATTLNGNVVRIADVNRDNKKDLITISSAAQGGLKVALQTSAGNFGTPQSYSTSPYPAAFEVADVSGDGNPEALIANDPPFSSGSLSVLSANGSGAFQPVGADMPLGIDPRSLTVSALDASSALDIAIGSSNGIVTLLHGNGNGTFSAMGTFTAPGADFVTAADLDQNNSRDLIATGPTVSRASVFTSDGNGVFTWRVDLGTGGTGPSGVLAANFGNDYRQDVVVINNLGSGIGPTDASSVVVLDNQSVSGAIVDVETPNTPELALSAPRPNPSVGHTDFTLELPVASGVKVELYDIAGRSIRSMQHDFAAGIHRLAWDHRADDGAAVSPGVYLCRVSACGTSKVARVVVTQ